MRNQKIKRLALAAIIGAALFSGSAFGQNILAAEPYENCRKPCFVFGEKENFEENFCEHACNLLIWADGRAKSEQFWPGTWQWILEAPAEPPHARLERLWKGKEKTGGASPQERWEKVKIIAQLLLAKRHFEESIARYRLEESIEQERLERR